MRVVARQDVPKGETKDPQVEPDRPVVDVIQVVLYPLLEIAVATEVVDLRLSGNAGPDEVLLHVTRDALTELAHELGALRARSDKRHVALQHV